MAGNLREYPLALPDGSVKAGKEFRYGHAPAAYGKLTEENVLYLGCHDNETLYDQVVLKANHAGRAEACARIVQMAQGLIAVSQGIAFFHAGDELLRSKSLDRDSYNSGDWCAPTHRAAPTHALHVSNACIYTCAQIACLEACGSGCGCAHM